MLDFDEPIEASLNATPPSRSFSSLGLSANEVTKWSVCKLAQEVWPVVNGHKPNRTELRRASGSQTLEK